MSIFDIASVGLKIALDAAKVIPGFSEASGMLQIAEDAVPGVQMLAKAGEAFLKTDHGKAFIHDVMTQAVAKGEVSHDPVAGTVTVGSITVQVEDRNDPSSPEFYGNG